MTAKTVIEVGHRAVGDEPLGAGQDVVVAVADRPRADPGDVRACLCLGQGERDQLLARGKIGEPAGLLLVGADRDQRQRSELVDGQDQPGRRAGPAELFDRETDRQQLATEAAVLGRERQRQDVLRGQQLAEVLGEFAGPIRLGRPRGDTLVGENPDRVAKECLLLGQSVGGLRRFGHRGHRSSEVPGWALRGRMAATAPGRQRTEGRFVTQSPGDW